MAACWGGSWLAGRLVAELKFHPLLAASWRFLFGSLGFLLVLAWTRGFVPPVRAAWPPLLLMAASGILIYNLCFFYGLRFVPAGRASLIVATQPALVFLLMTVSGRERPTLLRAVGLACSMAGAGLVLAQGNPLQLFSTGSSKGDFVILGCMVSWVTYTLAGRWAMRHMQPLPVAAYSTFLGTVMLLGSSVVSGAAESIGPEAIPLKAWLAFAFLGLCGTTLAFVWYMDGVREIGPSRATIFLNLVPVFGVLLSVALLGEPLTEFTIGGGVLVLAGVRLLNR